MSKLTPKTPLPPIPSKRYFSIGEVSELCAVKPHVLRYWEEEFKQIKPSKRQGNRRYYLQEDVETIREVRYLLYDQGFTIDGARMQLRNGPSMSVPEVTENIIQDSINTLEDVIRDLESKQGD